MPTPTRHTAKPCAVCPRGHGTQNLLLGAMATALSGHVFLERPCPRQAVGMAPRKSSPPLLAGRGLRGGRWPGVAHCKGRREVLSWPRAGGRGPRGHDQQCGGRPWRCDCRPARGDTMFLYFGYGLVAATVRALKNYLSGSNVARLSVRLRPGTRLNRGSAPG
jgi:hypothetical protein